MWILGAPNYRDALVGRKPRCSPEQLLPAPVLQNTVGQDHDSPRRTRDEHDALDLLMIFRSPDSPAPYTGKERWQWTCFRNFEVSDVVHMYTLQDIYVSL